MNTTEVILFSWLNHENSRLSCYCVHNQSDCITEACTDTSLMMFRHVRNCFFAAGNVAYMDAMPDLMSETISMGTLGKQAEYDRRRRRKYVDVVFFNSHDVSCI